MKKNFVRLSAIIILASFGSIEAKVSYDYYFGSVFCAKPIRMDELDGAMIVRLSQENNRFVPVLYPSRQTLFHWIDSGDVNLLTYEQYLYNPKLYVKLVPSVEKDLFAGSPEPRNESGEEDKFADSAISSILLPEPRSIPLPPLPPPRPVALPGDHELRAFLVRNRTGEKVDSIEKPTVSDQMIPPPPPPKMPVESTVSPLGQAFADPNLLKEYQRLVNSSTLGRINAKSAKGGGIETRVEIGGVPANLKLKASKRTKDGRIQPAQASEFYLTTQNLRELFKDMDVERALSGEIKSVAEIWAHAEKNLNTNPEVALGVKSILLQAKVGRARTNPFGEASLSDLPPDEKYFLIGIDKDENTNVVTIWSKEVEVNPGDNEVELSSSDVIYQD
ncbi:MAG: hypothetical protein HN531_13045 [Opitutae bacterium]|nr:hypothetical protein [Opitutae bacterium]